jgi:hypothetical protein
MITRVVSICLAVVVMEIVRVGVVGSVDNGALWRRDAGL